MNIRVFASFVLLFIGTDLFLERLSAHDRSTLAPVSQFVDVSLRDRLLQETQDNWTSYRSHFPLANLAKKTLICGVLVKS